MSFKNSTHSIEQLFYNGEKLILFKFFILFNNSFSFFPLIGGRPDNIIYNTIPSDHISTFSSY